MLKIRYFVTCAVCVAVAAVMAAGPARAADADKQAAGEKQRKLIGVLRSDAPPQDKAITCKQLAVYGSEEAVPALAALLSDAQLASWARIALEAIPGPAADGALREAAGKLQGKLLVGVINSIGVRRDAKAVDALVPRLKDTDVEVAAAAAVALGRIGGAPAAKALEQSLAGGPAAVRTSVAEGCILCAERFLADGSRDEAVRLYDTVRKADVPKQRLLEATRGAILARQSAGVPLLVEQLRSADKALLGLGLRLAREVPGPAVTEALVAELGKATPERQALLILALADRGDATALPAVLEVAKSGPNKVRIVAIGAMQRLGNASCVPVLLEAALTADAESVQAAKVALGGMPGREVDADLAARLGQAKGKMRQLLIELAGQRQIAAALPALLKAADDPDGQVRSAALTALGSTVGLGDLPVLIHRVVQPHEAQETKAAQEALSAACIRMADREACAEKLVAAMSRAPVAAKCRLLEILGAMGGAKALGAVGAAAKDASPEIQDAASRLLGEWMSVDAAPVLLDLAKTATDAKYQTRALRGYLRIARQLDVPLDQRVAMCREASKLCQRDEERKLVLEVLSRYPSAAGLSLATPHLRSAGLKAAASGAAVSIAEKVIQSDPAAVAEAMRQVVDAGGDPGVTNRAKALLDQAARKSAGKK
jgi:HEAT repeat protein